MINTAENIRNNLHAYNCSFDRRYASFSRQFGVTSNSVAFTRHEWLLNVAALTVGLRQQKMRTAKMRSTIIELCRRRRRRISCCNQPTAASYDIRSIGWSSSATRSDSLRLDRPGHYGPITAGPVDRQALAGQRPTRL